MRNPWLSRTPLAGDAVGRTADAGGMRIDGSAGQRSRARAASAVFVVAVGVSAVGVGTSAPASADIAQQIKDSQAQLDTLNTQSEAAAERYNAGRIKLGAAQLAATVAQAAAARETAALSAVKVQVGAFGAQLYRQGPGGLGLSLLTTGNPNEYLQSASMLSRISKSQSLVMNQLAVDMVRQATAASFADGAVATATSALRSLDKDKAQVSRAAAQTLQILKDLQVKQAQLIQAARDVASRRAAQARAEQLAAQARATAAAARAFAASPDRERVVSSSTHYTGTAAHIAMRVAMDQLGKPYEWGASGPDTFDCSGLTMFAYAKAGISLPHYTGDQYNQGHHVPQSDLQPGDLIFFEKNLGHMGMYIGNGQFIHAPHTGDVVKISDLAGYYQDEYQGAVRL